MTRAPMDGFVIPELSNWAASLAARPRLFHDDQVVLKTPPVSWGFDDRGPSTYIQHHGSYSREVRVDPAPAYAHNADLVQYELERLQRLAPLPFPLAIFVMDHEEVGRINGTYWDEADYKADIGEGESYPQVGVIVLSGKRIPHHPAMTRYLVSHEYGHAVQYHLERAWATEGKKRADIVGCYRETCRPDASKGKLYGPGKWHAAIGELFANDFRILVAKREEEFWPHEGYDRPEDVPSVVDFWTTAQRKLGWPQP
jgi:hypothetical protein